MEQKQTFARLLDKVAGSYQVHSKKLSLVN